MERFFFYFKNIKGETLADLVSAESLYLAILKFKKSHPHCKTIVSIKSVGKGY